MRCYGVAHFLCGISVNKILPCGIEMISNPTVYDVCVLKPTVFGETKFLCSVAATCFTLVRIIRAYLLKVRSIVTLC